MIDHELYYFDSAGFYHKKNAVSKNLIDQANYLYDENYSSYLKTQHIKVKGFESNKIFLDLLTHDFVDKICNVCYGPAFRLDHLHIAEQNNQTTDFLNLHGEFFGQLQSHYYISYPQRHIKDACYTRTGQLSVGIVLKPQNRETGGYCYIPGSHKSSYHVTGAELRSSILKDVKTANQYVIVPDLDAGDIIAFPENLIHGNTVMTTSSLRRILYGMYFPYSITFKYNNTQIDDLEKVADEEQKRFLTRNIKEMNEETYKYRPLVRHPFDGWC